jgi:hypothetical protein
MTPLWWKLNEIPVRHLTWYSFNGWAGIVGDLVSYGLGHATNSKVPTWELIFIVSLPLPLFQTQPLTSQVFGSFTSLWGIYMFFFLPDSPPSARFLDEKQKIIAVKRVAENRTGTKNTEFKVEQVKEALSDPKCVLVSIPAVRGSFRNYVDKLQDMDPIRSLDRRADS